MELRNRLRAATGVEASGATLVFDYPTPKGISPIICTRTMSGQRCHERLRLMDEERTAAAFALPAGSIPGSRTDRALVKLAALGDANRRRIGAIDDRPTMERAIAGWMSLVSCTGRSATTDLSDNR